MSNRKSQLSDYLSRNRPEKAVQFILTGAAITGLAYFVFAVLSPLYPTLLPLLAFFIITSSAIFLSLDARSKGNVAAWIKRGFVAEKPNVLGFLEEQLDQLAYQIDQTGKGIGQMRKEMHKVSRQIQQNRKTIQKSIENAQKAQDKSKRKDYIIQSRKAGRLEQSNKKYEALFLQMEEISSVLSTMYQYANLQFESFEDQLDIQRTELEMYTSAKLAMDQAKQFQSSSNNLEATIKSISSGIDQTIGKLELTLENAQSFFDRNLDETTELSNDNPVLLLTQSDEWTEIQETIRQKENQVLDLEDNPETKAKPEKETDNRYDDYLDHF